jgi:NADH/NAD ratio-sensing transcriptional regulator Rex
MNNYTYTLTKSENDLKDTLFKILEKFKNRKVAIWGAGLHTTYILNLLEKRAEQIFCFFDNDKQKDGLTLDNKPIYYYKNILDIEGKVDCIIISSVSYENKIYEQLKILEEANIKIFKMYDKREII